MTLRLAMCWAALASLGLGAHWISRGADLPLARVERSHPAQTISLPWSEHRCVEIDLEVLRSAPTGGRPRVSLDLVDASGSVVRSFESPVDCWMPGTSTRHRVLLDPSRLSPPLRPGLFELTGGLVDAESGSRWPVEDAGKVGKGFAVGKVSVPEPFEAELP